MTSDEFHADYRPGQILTSRGVRTSLAQETRKGRIVLVHELAPADEQERQRVLLLLNQLAPEDASQVIGLFAVDGEPVVVTKFLLGFTSFLVWLESVVAGQSTKVIDTRGEPPISAAATQDRPPAPDAPTQDQSPATSRPSGEVPYPADGPPSSSFTKLFGDSTPAAAPKGDVAPADFTEMFGSSNDKQPVSGASPGIETGSAPVGPILNQPAAEPPISSRTGERAPVEPVPDEALTTADFTKLFGGQSAPAPTPTAPPPLRPTAATGPSSSPPAPVVHRPAATSTPRGTSPSSPTFDESGAPAPPRLRLDALDGPSSSAASVGRAGQESVSGSLPGAPIPAFQQPDSGSNAGYSENSGAPFTLRPELRPPPRQPAAPASPGIGGYTAVLTPARPPLNPPSPRTPTPVVTPAPPPAPPRPSYLPLILGLSAFLVVAIGLVIYFVMSGS